MRLETPGEVHRENWEALHFVIVDGWMCPRWLSEEDRREFAFQRKIGELADLGLLMDPESPEPASSHD